jgi:hypothetical protein
MYQALGVSMFKPFQTVFSAFISFILFGNGSAWDDNARQLLGCNAAAFSEF